MSKHAWGSSLTQTSATPQSAPGSLAEDGEGNLWMYVKNSTGSSIPATKLVVSASATRSDASPGAAGALKSTVLGVTEVAIPAGEYGWVKRRGAVVADSSAAVAAGEAVLADASAEIRGVASGSLLAGDIAEVIGHVVTGNGAAGTCTIWLDL